ncbi:MAG: hypothetical protein HOJ34_12945 [Kordiimonadaceae bacterium]|jgi:hypothetical protein|nr:hypothetical protein [Kordiimonadaceae bacterium]MBT6035401.1 hypothetical protein [Kordiimonadaceae bacterium]MBT6330679.1 hypothetical protein [Kordiimonadaceae bacterium]
MATVLIHYQSPENFDHDTLIKIMEESANNTFRGMEHLYNKQFCYDIKTGKGMSVYWWDSLDNARAYFTAEWEIYFEKKFGCKAQIEYYDTPLTLDNRMDDIVYD